jgi:colanic acid biosynthesis glycosyl transferase WcaI
MTNSSSLLFITQHYSPEIIGSAPFCVDIAEWLSSNDRQVSVVTGQPYYPDPQNFADYRFRSAERINGVRINRVRTLRARRNSVAARLIAEISFVLLGLLALARRRIRRHDVVLSLSPSIFSVALGWILCKRQGRHVAIVFDIQSGLAQGLSIIRSRMLVRLMKWLERTILNRTDLILVLTDEMRTELRHLGVAVKIELISIWVDVNEFTPNPKVSGLATKIAYSGNLGYKQGLHQIFNLAEKLQPRHPDVEILIRGSGTQANEVAREIKRRGLANVRTVGLLPRNKFASGLAKEDIHLVPLDPSAALFMLPSKIFNIMAVGVPFVTTAQEGSALWQLMERSEGFLCVRPNAADELLEAVSKLLSDQAFRAKLGTSGRHYIERFCRKERVLSYLVTLIDGSMETPRHVP